MDGTFKVCPKEFGLKQVYTILAYGQFGHEAVPVVIAFLNGKTQATYEQLLTVVRTELIRRFNGIGNVAAIITDFEVAMLLAVRNVSPKKLISIQVYVQCTLSNSNIYVHIYRIVVF